MMHGQLWEGSKVILLSLRKYQFVFDPGHLIGIGEYEMDRGEVTFPSTCRCNSCQCEPCDQKTEVCMQKNGKHGGKQT